jgi:hypothetical protein
MILLARFVDVFSKVLFPTQEFPTFPRVYPVTGITIRFDNTNMKIELKMVL